MVRNKMEIINEYTGLTGLTGIPTQLLHRGTERGLGVNLYNLYIFSVNANFWNTSTGNRGRA